MLALRSGGKIGLVREIVDLLLDYGADGNAKDDSGETALDYARRAKKIVSKLRNRNHLE